MEHSPDLSIVMPTRDRREVLIDTLDTLARCKREGFRTETVVVDDGSVDGSRDLLEARDDIKLVREDGRGPAVARNAGVRESSGKFVLFLGDDTIPDLSILEVHMRELRAEEDRAVLGHVAWDPRLRLTPFMRYATRSGLQFGYELIKDHEDVPHDFFYTANVSAPRSWLVEHAFNEDFPYAAVEDVELAYRLRKAGLKTVYRPDALCYHYHPIRFNGYCRRIVGAGESALLLHELHPELPMPAADFALPAWFRLLAPLMKFKIDLMDRVGIPFPAPFYRGVLAHYFLIGYRRGVIR